MEQENKSPAPPVYDGSPKDGDLEGLRPLEEIESAFVTVGADSMHIILSSVRPLIAQVRSLSASLEATRKALALAITEFKHDVPGSCWSTGPLTGTAMDSICRGCMVIEAAEKALAATPKKGESPEEPCT